MRAASVLVDMEPKAVMFWRLWAQVAELVDAQASGACGGNLVEVRVFSWAPYSRCGTLRSAVESGKHIDRMCGADLVKRLK